MAASLFGAHGNRVVGFFRVFGYPLTKTGRRRVHVAESVGKVRTVKRRFDSAIREWKIGGVLRTFDCLPPFLAGAAEAGRAELLKVKSLVEALEAGGR